MVAYMSIGGSCLFEQDKLTSSHNTENMTSLIWDSPLDTVNMFHYHWLIKKLLSPTTEQNRAKQEN